MNPTNRNYSLDFLKFIAAIFITNSHFIPVYKDVNVGLATLGVHGNALFFFVAGYLLIAGLDVYEDKFDNWYKKRIQRLWPAVFLWSLIASIVWGDVLNWQAIIVAPRYWFLQCIAIYYAIYYFVGKKMLKKGVFLYFLFAIISSVAYALFMPKSEGSIFHTSWHYVCHFSVMILGGMAYLYRDKFRSNHLFLDILGVGVSFVIYFAIMVIGKGQSDWKYYTQILALLPIHTFCWFAYKVCSYGWCDKIFMSKILRWPFFIVTNLTLEIYIVQFHVISDRYNDLFPLNWFIVFVLICAVAYLLRVAINVFIQFMRKENWSWSEVVHI